MKAQITTTNFERILAQHADDQKPWFHFEKLIRDNLAAIYEPRGHRFSDVKLTTAGTPGIDHFAIDEDGQRWAIQTKLYNRLYYVSEPDIAAFIAHSKRSDYHVDHMLLVATTNRIGHNAQKLINNTFGFHTLLLDDLESYDWTDEQAQPVERFELRHDQPRALKQILAGFEHSGKGRYISPPGTGKTLVGLKAAEGLNARVTLVLESSIGLLDQVEREWLEQADPAKPLQSLRVYSQKEVDDDMEEYAAQRMTAPTTDPAEIADWLLCNLMDADSRLVIFTTYHSSPRVLDAVQVVRELIPNFEFDFINADEAHRTTGIDDDAAFKTVHKIPATKVLFQTATQRVTDPDSDQTPVIAMDDENYYGPEYYHLTFGRAVDEGWLTDYKPLIPIITPDTILSLIKRRKYVRDAEAMLRTDGRSLACAVYLLKTIWEYDRRKIIAFHNSRKSAKHFLDTVLPSAAKWLGIEAPLTLYIDGTKTRGEKAETMGQFRDAPGPAIIANVRVLTEGIDTPSVDGVIFVDPRYSQIDIAQAVGRALRLSDGKAYSLVMIPAFTDSLNDYDETLHKGEFAEVSAIVRQMGFDERIEAKIRLATQQGPWKPPLKQKESAEWVAEDVAANEWSEAIYLAVFNRKEFMRAERRCFALDSRGLSCPKTPRRRHGGILVCDGHSQQWIKGRPYTVLQQGHLTSGDKAEIQHRANHEGEAHTKLAEEFGTSVTKIGRIAKLDDGYVRPRGTRKLTDAKVAEIRQRVNVDGELASRVAKDYGVGVAQICRAVSGETWTHVPMVGQYVRHEDRLGLGPIHRYGNIYPRASQIGETAYGQFIQLRDRYREGLALDEREFHPEVWRFLSLERGKRNARKEDARTIGSPEWLEQRIHSFGNVCPKPSEMGTAYQLFCNLRAKYRDGLALNEQDFHPEVWKFLNVKAGKMSKGRTRNLMRGEWVSRPSQGRDAGREIR